MEVYGEGGGVRHSVLVEVYGEGGGVRCSVLVEVYGEGGRGQMQCPGGGVR